MSGDDTIIEEEFLVYAELCDNTDPNIFSHADTSFKSFALDSEQPILTIGGQAFVGRYKDTVGTAVFLEETPQETEELVGFGNEPSDPLFVDSPSKKLQYICHTRKSLEMSRVLLIEKKKQCEDLGNQEVNNECLTYEHNDVIECDEMEGWKSDKDSKEEKSEIMNNLYFSDVNDFMKKSNNVDGESEKTELQDNNMSCVVEEAVMIRDIEKMMVITDSGR